MIRSSILLLVLAVVGLAGCSQDDQRDTTKPMEMLNKTGKPRTDAESNLDQKNQQGGKSASDNMEKAAEAQRKAQGK